LPSHVKNHNGTALRAKALLLISNGVLIFLQDLRIPILNQSGQVNATLLLVGAIVGGDVVPHCKVFWATTLAFITRSSSRCFAMSTLFSMHSRALLLGVSSRHNFGL
jgi:hypothetical protein